MARRALADDVYLAHLARCLPDGAI